MNKLTEILKKFFKDDKSIKDVLNFVITLVIVLSAALLIGNVFFNNKSDDNPVIFDNDSKIINEEENLYMDEEQRLSDILSKVKGVGNVKVMMTFGNGESRETVVKGVLVVAEGAGDNVIKDKIISAAQSAFGIPVSRITVLESK